MNGVVVPIPGYSIAESEFFEQKVLQQSGIFSKKGIFDDLEVKHLMLQGGYIVSEGEIKKFYKQCEMKDVYESSTFEANSSSFSVELDNDSNIQSVAMGAAEANAGIQTTLSPTIGSQNNLRTNRRITNQWKNGESFYLEIGKNSVAAQYNNIGLGGNYDNNAIQNLSFKMNEIDVVVGKNGSAVTLEKEGQRVGIAINNGKPAFITNLSHKNITANTENLEILNMGYSNKTVKFSVDKNNGIQAETKIREGYDVGIGITEKQCSINAKLKETKLSLTQNREGINWKANQRHATVGGKLIDSKRKLPVTIIKPIIQREPNSGLNKQKHLSEKREKQKHATPSEKQKQVEHKKTITNKNTDKNEAKKGETKSSSKIIKKTENVIAENELEQLDLLQVSTVVLKNASYYTKLILAIQYGSPFVLDEKRTFKVNYRHGANKYNTKNGNFGKKSTKIQAVSIDPPGKLKASMTKQNILYPKDSPYNAHINVNTYLLHQIFGIKPRKVVADPHFFDKLRSEPTLFDRVYERHIVPLDKTVKFGMKVMRTAGYVTTGAHITGALIQDFRDSYHNREISLNHFAEAIKDEVQDFASFSLCTAATSAAMISGGAIIVILFPPSATYVVPAIAYGSWGVEFAVSYFCADKVKEMLFEPKPAGNHFQDGEKIEFQKFHDWFGEQKRKGLKFEQEDKIQDIFQNVNHFLNTKT